MPSSGNVSYVNSTPPYHPRRPVLLSQDRQKFEAATTDTAACRTDKNCVKQVALKGSDATEEQMQQSETMSLEIIDYNRNNPNSAGQTSCDIQAHDARIKNTAWKTPGGGHAANRLRTMNKYLMFS